MRGFREDLAWLRTFISAWKENKVKRLIVPDGWPCSLRAAEPGPFMISNVPDEIYFKSEYHHDDGRIIAYCPSGEFFCGGEDYIVQPVKVVTVEEED